MTNENQDPEYDYGNSFEEEVDRSIQIDAGLNKAAKASGGSLFGISPDFMQPYQNLDERFVKNKFTTFFFGVKTDCMEPLIWRGQIVAVDRSISEFSGRVCIVSYQGEMICRRVFKINDQLVLSSENAKYKDIRIMPGDNFIFWGVVSSNHGFVK